MLGMSGSMVRVAGSVEKPLVCVDPRTATSFPAFLIRKQFP